MTKATANKVNDKTDKVQAYFTPPWAIRQICHSLTHDFGLDLSQRSAFDPSAGQGHCVHALRDYYSAVYADDRFDHSPANYTPTMSDYLHHKPAFEGDVVTNPPFYAFDDFARTAIHGGAKVTAMLVRVPALCGESRAEQLYAKYPPAAVMVYTRRPHMRPGPPPATGGKSAMDSIVVVWMQDYRPKRPEMVWLPTTRKAFTKKGDFFNTQPELYPDHEVA